ncbi:MAG: hypothetical protein HXY46_11405 [Syntrophaceae bacterium]|nr:hypothetical protein [Syntrophaceae bacterium]
MSRKMKKILVILSLVLILSIVLTSFGIAYAGGVRGVGLLGSCFFLTFGILIVLAQLVPAAMLLSSLIGTAFSSFRTGELPIRAT